MAVNVAVTVTGALPTNVQESVPAQLPLQPLNVEPEAAVAVSVTGLPAIKVAEHEAPQLIPAGTLTTTGNVTQTFEWAGLSDALGGDVLRLGALDGDELRGAMLVVVAPAPVLRRPICQKPRILPILAKCPKPL